MADGAVVAVALDVVSYSQSAGIYIEEILLTT